MSVLTQHGYVIMSAYRPAELVLARGEGAEVWDVDGKKYLDLVAGIACVALGHAHPKVNQALIDQASTLGHVSNVFATVPQVDLATRLTGLFDPSAKVFFTNSGAEANEAALKITRLTGKTRIVSTQGAFHGRTMGALSLTGTPAYRTPFEPLPTDVVWVPYGDVDALSQAVDSTTAAIVLEPIQGEAGVIVPPDGYLQAVREIADSHGALMWLDEIQTGMGRTGTMFAYQHEPIIPDVITLAKALGNGFPMGAVLARGEAADLFTPGSHGTTFGGNPLAARVGLTVIDLIEPLLGHVTQIGAWLMDQLRHLPGVREVRGRGLMVGIVLEENIAPNLVRTARAHGFLVNAPRENLIRLVPPLIVDQGDLEPLIDLWPTLIKEAS
jgi:acetylornithine aminotransferase